MSLGKYRKRQNTHEDIERIVHDTESKQKRGRNWGDFNKSAGMYFIRMASTEFSRMGKRKEHSKQSRGGGKDRGRERAMWSHRRE